MPENAVTVVDERFVTIGKWLLSGSDLEWRRLEIIFWERRVDCPVKHGLF